MARDQSAGPAPAVNRQKRPGGTHSPGQRPSPRPKPNATIEPPDESLESFASSPAMPPHPLPVSKPLVEKVLQEAKAHLEHQLRAIEGGDLDAMRTEEMAHASRLAHAAERLREFDVISDVANSNTPIEESLDALLETTSIIMGSQTAAILLVDEEGEQLWPRASIGFKTTLAVRPEPVNGIIWDLVRTGTPVIIPDLQPDQQFRAGLIEEGVHSLVAVPLRMSGAVGGVLVCGHEQTNWFGPTDSELLQIIGAAIAAGFERTRGIETQTRRRRTSDRTSSFRSELLNMAAHDIKTPLTTLALQLHLVADSRLPEEKRQLAAATMKRGIARMTAMLDDFLDLARAQGDRLTIQPRNLKVADLLADVADAFQPVAKEQGLGLQAVTPGSYLEVLGDERRIIQVLNNLVSNAIRYSAPGGTIRLEAKEGDGVVEFHVRDEGRGLAPEQIARLFQPFVQVHDVPGSSTGSGLGLYLSKAIITAHGGRIWIASPGPEQGTDAAFTLPKVATPTNLTAPTRPTPAPTGALP